MFTTMSSYEKSGTYNSDVLDLSRPSHHRDSVETRRTPSPSNTSSFSSEGSPVNQQHHSYPIKVRNDISNFLAKSPVSHVVDSYEPSYTPIGVLPCFPQASSPPQLPTFPAITALSSNFTTEIKQRLSPSPNGTPFMPLTHQLEHLEHIYRPQSNEHPLKSPEISENFITTSSANSTTTSKPYPMVMGRDGKLSRPFKAYPNDPISMAASFTATDSILNTCSAEKYHLFRKRMLEQIRAANGGQQTVTNPKMRRNTMKSVSSEDSSLKNNNSLETNNNMPGSPFGNDGDSKDPTYFERRKKNNMAAKKSRDKRREKEDEIAIRAAYLERENIELKFQLAAVQKQLALHGVVTTN